MTPRSKVSDAVTEPRSFHIAIALHVAYRATMFLTCDLLIAQFWGGDWTCYVEDGVIYCGIQSWPSADVYLWASIWATVDTLLTVRGVTWPRLALLVFTLRAAV